MYEALRDFLDVIDNHLYHAGDSFPRAGVRVSKARIAELASDKNRCGVPLIKTLPKAPEASESAKKEVTKRKTKKEK